MRIKQKIIGIALLLLSLFLWSVSSHLLTIAPMEATIKATIAPFMSFGVFLILSSQNVFK